MNRESEGLAGVLKRVVDYWRRGECEVRDEYILCGPALEPTQDGGVGYLEAQKALDALGEYVARLRVDRRTSLNEDSDLSRHLQKSGVSDRGRRFLQDDVLDGEPLEQVKLPRSGPEASDDIEQHFAQELVRKLPRIVERAVQLDEMNDIEVDKEAVPGDVKNYWHEAHRCHVYGFPVACVVLCRAILESALEALLDPSSEVAKKQQPGTSYFRTLVEMAKARKMLTDDRPEWALQIRDAGNDAIHGLDKFNLRWQGKVRDILDNTRKVIEDLYKHDRAGSQ